MPLLNIKIKLPHHLQFNIHWLTDCAFLSKVFATDIIELKECGDYQRRLINMRGHKFTERVIHLCATSLVYQIEGIGPVKNHQGNINYIRSSDGHYLHYQIKGQSNTWVPSWLLKIVMFYDFKRAGKRLGKLLNER